MHVIANDPHEGLDAGRTHPGRERAPTAVCARHQLLVLDHTDWRKRVHRGIRHAGDQPGLPPCPGATAATSPATPSCRSQAPNGSRQAVLPMNADPFQNPQSQLKQSYHLADTAYRRGVPSQPCHLNDPARAPQPGGRRPARMAPWPKRSLCPPAGPEHATQIDLLGATLTTTRQAETAAQAALDRSVPTLRCRRPRSAQRCPARCVRGRCPLLDPGDLRTDRQSCARAGVGAVCCRS